MGRGKPRRSGKRWVDLVARRVSVRGIKAHRQYTYEEAARVLGVTAQTVRAWRKLGLVVIDDQKPHLIVGACLKAFIANRTDKPKLELQAHEFRCLHCGTARGAWGALADYIPHTPVRGRLEALCEVCEGKCCKFASTSQLPGLARFLTIAIRNGAQGYRNPSTLTQTITSTCSRGQVQTNQLQRPHPSNKRSFSTW